VTSRFLVASGTNLLARGFEAVPMHVLLEDAAPVRTPVAGLAVANGVGDSVYVPRGSDVY
jgi:hypothetical protein